MPLCLIDDTDKHILEGDWQTAGNWEYPFRRYKSAGFGKIIKDVKGRSVDLETYTLQQHFDMLGYKVDRLPNFIYNSKQQGEHWDRRCVDTHL